MTIRDFHMDQATLRARAKALREHADMMDRSLDAIDALKDGLPGVSGTWKGDKFHAPCMDGLRAMQEILDAPPPGFVFEHLAILPGVTWEIRFSSPNMPRESFATKAEAYARIASIDIAGIITRRVA